MLSTRILSWIKEEYKLGLCSHTEYKEDLLTWLTTDWQNDYQDNESIYG